MEIGDDLDFWIQVVSLDEEKLIVETRGSGSRINLVMSWVNTSFGLKATGPGFAWTGYLIKHLVMGALTSGAQTSDFSFTDVSGFDLVCKLSE